MDLFDKISESASPAVVRSNGDIVKCMDDVRDGFQVRSRKQKEIEVHAELHGRRA